MAKVLVLVNPATLQILSTKDYLSSFELFSKHDVSYLPEVPPAWRASGQSTNRTEKDYSEILSSYDVVVVSQHLRPCFDGWINDSLNSALLKFKGLKILFLHDEYDHTEKTRLWIEEHVVDIVYTVVPEPHVSKVYNPARFPKTQFRSILTGYLPLKFSSRNQSLPISERQHLIVYRGRVSPESYGELAKQKETIGRYFDSYCQQNQIGADIQWEEAERVYGLDWYKLLETGVATLGTESGSNIFDEHGLIRKHVDQGKSLPGPSSLNFREENLGFKMNQVSPRLFEAIGCGTALVLYDGDYSGVLAANEHFLTVKQDHSNVADIIEKLQDSNKVQRLVDRAWEYVASNEELRFSHMISLFDADISDNLVKRNLTPVSGALAQQHLLVGEFSDISATGIGVFSELHKYASTINSYLGKSIPTGVKVVASEKLRKFPVIKRLVKRLYNHLLSIVSLCKRFVLLYKRMGSYVRIYGYHWLRKVFRIIPNTFPVLGRLRRKFLKTK